MWIWHSKADSEVLARVLERTTGKYGALAMMALVQGKGFDDYRLRLLISLS